jgi:catechol 2,3-dioxygenase-like lactoylglutathione lyase family enzyme
MTANPTFTSMHTVAVVVSDQDRSKALFEELGLVERMDVELQPGFRWIELGLPDGQTTLSLVAAASGQPTGLDTGIRLATADARRAHAAVTALGLDAGDLLDWESAPLMFEFRDHDGNVFYVSETS